MEAKMQDCECCGNPRPKVEGDDVLYRTCVTESGESIRLKYEDGQWEELPREPDEEGEAG